MLDAVGKEDLHLKAPIFLVLSRLFRPNFSAMARWLLVDPTTCSTYAAIGKDSFPKILKHLLDVSKGNSCPVAVRQDLVQSGLLSNGLENDWGPYRNFCSRYHRFIADYDFFDYSISDWKERDELIMKKYASNEAPPSVYTPRHGPAWSLPEVDLEDIALIPSEDTLYALSLILKYTFKAIGRVPEPDGPWLRKTSPSGGARHPTDGMVILRRGLKEIPAGAYYYEPDTHSLVGNADRRVDHNVGDLLEDPVIAISLICHVERPMWRYREARSLRATLIDAGHVAETLSLLAGIVGLEVARLQAGLTDFVADAWFDEPEVACFLLGKPETLRAQQSKLDLHWRAQTPSRASDVPIIQDLHVTNPFLYLTVEKGELWANVVWPIKSRISLSEADFLAINHCIPSTRGDRDTSDEALQSKFALSEARIKQLAISRIFLTARDGAEAYKSLAPWAKHDWYLCALLLGEYATDAATTYTLLSDASEGSLLPLSRTQVAGALLKRRTTRRFSDAEISLATLLRILGPATQSLGNGSKTWKLFVAGWKVGDLDIGKLYEWNSRAASLEIQQLETNSSDVQNATIGQFPSASGAATIWIARTISCDTVPDYTDTLLDLGRLGQRICLTAAALDVGVFMTPALHDTQTTRLLGLSDSGRWAIYLLSIGYPLALAS